VTATPVLGREVRAWSVMPGGEVPVRRDFPPPLPQQYIRPVQDRERDDDVIYIERGPAQGRDRESERQREYR